MWRCPKCKKEFKNNNQQHYCGEKPKTVEEYILIQEEERRSDLFAIRQALLEALPDAKEKISWSMPTYWQGHNIIHFAAAKNHIGLYPGPEAVSHFKDQLKNHKTDKGTIRIPYGTVDRELVREIARWCLETGNHA